MVQTSEGYLTLSALEFYWIQHKIQINSNQMMQPLDATKSHSQTGLGSAKGTLSTLDLCHDWYWSEIGDFPEIENYEFDIIIVVVVTIASESGDTQSHLQSIED